MASLVEFKCKTCQAICYGTPASVIIGLCLKCLEVQHQEEVSKIEILADIKIRKYIRKIIEKMARNNCPPNKPDCFDCKQTGCQYEKCWVEFMESDADFKELDK